MQSLLRREALDPKARLELFTELAEYFKTVVAFPQQATDGISPEQYVRNVVEVLFQAHRPGQETVSPSMLQS